MDIRFTWWARSQGLKKDQYEAELFVVQSMSSVDACRVDVEANKWGERTVNGSIVFSNCTYKVLGNRRIWSVCGSDGDKIQVKCEYGVRLFGFGKISLELSRNRLGEIRVPILRTSFGRIGWLRIGDSRWEQFLLDVPELLDGDRSVDIPSVEWRLCNPDLFDLFDCAETHLACATLLSVAWLPVVLSTT